jgi:hypothetical protein
MIIQQQQQSVSTVTVISNNRPLPAQRGQRSFKALKQQQLHAQLQETVEAILPEWEKKLSAQARPVNSAFLAVDEPNGVVGSTTELSENRLKETETEEDDDRHLAKVGPYRQWSPSAVACFVRKANCEGCFYKNFFSDSPQGCQMAEAVKHLIVKLGVPSKRHLTKVH